MEHKTTIDASFEAVKIIEQHTQDYMRGASFVPTSAEDLYDKMTEECSHILTTNFLNGRYNPMEYNAIRNEIAKILWNLFRDHMGKSTEAN